MKAASIKLTRIAQALAGALVLRLPFWFIVAWSHPNLCNWDCGIYSNISRHYTAAESAFFPVFPWLVHGAQLLLPFLSPEASVVFVSNLFVPLAGALFLFLADGLWASGGKKSGRKFAGFELRSWLALLLLSVFPEGHFWMRGYSEPVFFSLLMAILLGIRLGLQRENWLLAGVCTGLIAVTRPQGIWVAAIAGPYLLWRWLWCWRCRNGAKPTLALSVILCGLPFLVFMSWLWARTGNPIYFYTAQHGWGRGFDLWGALKDQLPRWDASHLYLYLGLWAGFRYIRRPKPEWRMIGILSLVLSELPLLFGGFYSYVRFASVNPAIFLLASELIWATGWAMSGVTLAVVIWWVIRLAIQVHLAGSGWAG